MSNETEARTVVVSSDEVRSGDRGVANFGLRVKYVYERDKDSGLKKITAYIMPPEGDNHDKSFFCGADGELRRKISATNLRYSKYNQSRVVNPEIGFEQIIQVVNKWLVKEMAFMGPLAERDKHFYPKTVKHPSQNYINTGGVYGLPSAVVDILEMAEHSKRFGRG